MASDVIVMGAGLVGLSLARELQRQQFQVRVLEARKAGGGASWAAAGMLAGYQTQHPGLRPLAIAAARLYPSWTAELERETYLPSGYRRGGTLFVASPEHAAPAVRLDGWEPVVPGALDGLEPELRAEGEIWRVPEDHSVDNRQLMTALIASVRGRGIPLEEHTPVVAVEANGAGWTVRTEVRNYTADMVVNTAGAWAASFSTPVAMPVRPRKGQMLSLRSAARLRHVIAAPGVYLVPRNDGRILVGATVEDVGFAPGVEAAAIAELRQRAERVMPALHEATVDQSWAGYRPCAADDLPILGPTRCQGYWIATAHYRDGILLAPLTAKIIARAMATGQMTRALELTPFLPRRFEN